MGMEMNAKRRSDKIGTGISKKYIKEGERGREREREREGEMKQKNRKHKTRN